MVLRSVRFQRLRRQQVLKTFVPRNSAAPGMVFGVISLRLGIIVRGFISEWFVNWSFVDSRGICNHRKLKGVFFCDLVINLKRKYSDILRVMRTEEDNKGVKQKAMRPSSPRQFFERLYGHLENNDSSAKTICSPVQSELSSSPELLDR